MNINTSVVQRLRDALLDEARSAGAQQSLTSSDDESGQHRALLERFTPFAETMFLVAIADGTEDSSELDALRGAMHMLTAQQLSDDVLTDIFQRCRHNVSKFGIQRYIEMIGARLVGDRLDRETAFTLAAAVAMADDRVHGAETDILESIAEYFGISSSASRRLLEEI